MAGPCSPAGPTFFDDNQVFAGSRDRTGLVGTVVYLGFFQTGRQAITDCRLLYFALNELFSSLAKS